MKADRSVKARLGLLRNVLQTAATHPIGLAGRAAEDEGLADLLWLGLGFTDREADLRAGCRLALSALARMRPGLFLGWLDRIDALLAARAAFERVLGSWMLANAARADGGECLRLRIPAVVALLALPDADEPCAAAAGALLESATRLPELRPELSRALAVFLSERRGAVIPAAALGLAETLFRRGGCDAVLSRAVREALAGLSSVSAPRAAKAAGRLQRMPAVPT